MSSKHSLIPFAEALRPSVEACARMQRMKRIDIRNDRDDRALDLESNDRAVAGPDTLAFKAAAKAWLDAFEAFFRVRITSASVRLPIRPSAETPTAIPIQDPRIRLLGRALREHPDFFSDGVARYGYAEVRIARRTPTGEFSISRSSNLFGWKLDLDSKGCAGTFNDEFLAWMRSDGLRLFDRVAAVDLAFDLRIASAHERLAILSQYNAADERPA